MEAIKILEKTADLDWDYDSDADVLYISSGAPTPAITEDIGNGVLARYDPESKNLVGLTIYGLKDTLVQLLRYFFTNAIRDQLKEEEKSKAPIFDQIELERFLQGELERFISNPSQVIEDYKKTQELIESINQFQRDSNAALNSITIATNNNNSLMKQKSFELSVAARAFTVKEKQAINKRIIKQLSSGFKKYVKEVSIYLPVITDNYTKVKAGVRCLVETNFIPFMASFIARIYQNTIQGSLPGIDIIQSNLTNANDEYRNLLRSLAPLKSEINAVIKINEELINELDRQIDFSKHSLILIENYLAGKPPEFPAIDEE